MNDNAEQLEHNTILSPIIPAAEPDRDEIEIDGFDSGEPMNFRWESIIPVAELWDLRHQAAVEKLLREPFNPEISRRVVDFVISHAALQALTPLEREYINTYLEALAPLRNCGIPELEDCYYIILGNNAPDRQVPNDQLHTDFEYVETIFAEEKGKPGLNELPALDEGIEIIQITPDHPLWAQYIECIRHIEYDEEDTEDEICFAAIADGKVVSSGLIMADSTEVERNRQRIPIRRVEMTGAYTLPEYREQGIYKHLLRKEYQTLADEEDSVHLITGFTRHREPVLRAVARSGRMINDPSATEFGLKPRGLPLHNMADGELTTHYFNFLPGDVLRENIGKKN